MTDGNTLWHAGKEAVRLVKEVTASDMDATEYIAADWRMDSTTRHVTFLRRPSCKSAEARKAFGVRDVNQSIRAMMRPVVRSDESWRVQGKTSTTHHWTKCSSPQRARRTR